MTVLIFILVLALLVLAHEWGHFISARRAGLVVTEFGFGFPPRLFGWKRGDTVYSINLLPLGGFVKILGEDGGENQNQKSFASKSVSVRSLITASGVAMNFVLGAVLLIIGFNLGLPQVVDQSNAALARDVKIQIVAVSAGSPAREAGIKAGDGVKTIKTPARGPVEIEEITDLQNAVNEAKGQKVVLGIQRDGQILQIEAVPRLDAPLEEGALGIALVKTGIVSYPFYKSVFLGIKSAFILTWAVVLGLGAFLKELIFYGRLSQDVAGPVGIAVLTGQAARLGPIYLIQLTALISLNLAVLNLVPFPALDGGRLLFLGIEKIKGSRVSPKVENAIHAAGIVLLLALAAYITWRDILRLG